MFFYIFFLFMIAFLCGRYYVINQKNIQNKDLGYKTAIVFIILISSLRFNIGYDWSAYLKFVYPYYTPLNTLRLEPFDRVICAIAGKLKQPIILFSIYAIITYYILGITIYNYSVDKYTSLIIYLCLFYLSGLSTIRQEIAVAVVFYGYKYVKEKKLMKYLIICFLAMCFHKTAIIAISFYPIYYSSKNLIYTFIACSIVFFKVLLPKIIAYFFPFFMSYLDFNGIAKSSGNLTKLFYLFIYIYLFIISKRIDINKGLLNIVSIGVLLPFLLGGHTGGRLAEYFLLYYTLLIPEANRRFSINYRIIFLIPFYIFFFLFLYTSVNINKSNEYVPFRWYFLESLNQNLQ